jgi:hypothetical protein
MVEHDSRSWPLLVDTDHGTLKPIRSGIYPSDIPVEGSANTYRR